MKTKIITIKYSSNKNKNTITSNNESRDNYKYHEIKEMKNNSSSMQTNAAHQRRGNITESINKETKEKNTGNQISTIEAKTKTSHLNSQILSTNITLQKSMEKKLDQKSHTINNKTSTTRNSKTIKENNGSDNKKCQNPKQDKNTIHSTLSKKDPVHTRVGDEVYIYYPGSEGYYVDRWYSDGTCHETYYYDGGSIGMA